MFLPAIVLIILCLAVAFYFDARKRNNYWKQRGVATVTSNFIFGMSFDFLMGRRSLEQVHENIYNKAGPNERYVGFYNLLKPGLFIRDPELIHQMTVADFDAFHERAPSSKTPSHLSYSLNLIEGDEWKALRHKLSPIFTSSKLRNMYDLIQECAESLVDYHFRPSAESGEPLEMQEITSRYGLDVLGKCAFGLEFNTLQESASAYRDVGITFDDNKPGFKNEVRRHIMFDSKMLKLLGLKIVSTELEDFFFGLLNEAKKLRSEESGHRVDFLQTMLNLLKDQNGSHQFTENHIASNMLVFYVSTYDTTSISIAFALYELAMQPELQEKLRQEIKSARDRNDGVLDYVGLSEIAYLEMVISETLRLHAPTSFNFRMCTAETYQVPGSSLELKYGDVVSYSISAIHKDETYFPNPLKFDPERFSKENIARMNPYAYQPFGSGPRMCLGPRFAKLIMKVCVASVFSRFRVSRCEKTESPIVLRTTGRFHIPKNGIWLSVEEI